MRVSLFGLSPRRTTFVWLAAGEIEHYREARSSRYCPNISFVYVCTNCSFRDNTGYVCLAHNCRDTCYMHESFLIWIIPSTLYSTDTSIMKLCRVSNVSDPCVGHTFRVYF